MLQAPIFDGLSLDPFTLFDDGWCPAEVGIGGRHVVQALVVALVIVVFDEGLDLGLEVTGQEVVLEQDAVFGVGSGWGRNDTLSRCFLGPEIFAGQ